MESNNKKRKGFGGFIVLTVAVALLICGALGTGTYYLINNPTDIFLELPGFTENNNPSQSQTESPSIGNSEYIDPNVTALPNITPPPLDSTEPIADLYDKMIDTVVTVYAFSADNSGMATGSGVVFTENGYVLTNNHIVRDVGTVQVCMNDGTIYDAVIVGCDPRTDVAVLKIQSDATFHAAALGDSDALRIGQTIVAIGAPLGNAGSLTSGVVSYLNRIVDVDGVRYRLIQTDCPLNLGNSGGPMFNKNGEVVGIVVRKEIYTPTENGDVPVEGMSYAIPINTAKSIALELINSGYVKRGALGVTVQNNIVDYEYRGVKVVEVVAGGPAEAAGIQANDIIVEINSVKVINIIELSDQLSSKREGDTITVKYLRNNEEFTASVKLTLLVE